MRIIILILALTLSLGCATQLGGLALAWGDSSIGTDCDPEGRCKNLIRGGSLSSGLSSALNKVVGAVISLVPFAKVPSPDKLTVIIENADE